MSHLEDWLRALEARLHVKSKPQAVYLAGDMVTDWRDQVTASVPGLTWLVPESRPDWFEHQVAMMEQADICFAYIGTAARNIGTIAELSAFRVMGKPRILVIVPERAQDRGYDMALKLTDPGLVFNEMGDGISALKRTISRR